MEILKHGKTYGEITCEKCDCEFSFIGADTFTCTNPCEGITDIMVLCPECHKAIKVGETKRVI